MLLIKVLLFYFSAVMLLISFFQSLGCASDFPENEHEKLSKFFINFYRLMRFGGVALFIVAIIVAVKY